VSLYRRAPLSDPCFAVGTYTVPSSLLNFARPGTVMDGDDQMSNAKHIYDIADHHAQTVQVCIDRLHELGANEQLKLLTARLQKLVVRATAADDNQGTKAAQRQARRPQNLKGQPAKRASRIVGSQSLGNRE
jgi:hypothetical protein